MITHVTRQGTAYQPSNVTWAWLPPMTDRRLKKKDRYEALAARALAELATWLDTAPLATAAGDRGDLSRANVA